MNDDIEMSIGNDVTMKAASAAALGRIDHYELLKELGGGGFGTVYLARNTVAGIDVAVKGLPPLVRNNKEELENIRSNFALVQRLHHPNIAAALDLHPVREAKYEDKATAEKLRVFEGDTMMVMQYAPGVTLSQWRKQFPDRKVPLPFAISIVRQVAAALDEAHKQKIIHRDVKPANVMVESISEEQVVARVLDFGLAAEIRSSLGRISMEVRDTSGTRPYMAPEQWAGRKQGPATDQYALAVLFCELVTGEVPFSSVFECGDPAVMMTAVCNRPVELPDDCPCMGALMKALSKDATKRYSSCTEFCEALAASGSSMFAGGTRIPKPLAGGLIAAVLVIVACVVLFRPQPNAPVSMGTSAAEVKRHDRTDERQREEEVRRRQEAERAAAERHEQEERRREESRKRDAELREIEAKRNAEREAISRRGALRREHEAKEEDVKQPRRPSGTDASSGGSAIEGMDLEEVFAYVEKLVNYGYPDLAGPVIEATKRRWPESEARFFAIEIRGMLALGQFERAEKMIAALPDRKSTKYWAARLEVANNYFGRGQKPECMKIYDEFFRVFPEPPKEIRKFYMEACYAYGQILADGRQYAKAAQRYESLLAQLQDGSDEWCNLACETAGLYLHLAEDEKGTQSRWLGAAGKLIDRLLLQVEKPVYFSRGICLKARVAHMSGDTDHAIAIIDDYLPQLQDIHGQIMQYDPDGKKGLLKLSPLPECLYLKAKMLWDEALAEAKKSSGRNDDRIKDLMFGPKGNGGKRQGTKGAFNLAVSVFLNYETSASALDAGELSEQIKAFAEKEYGAKIKTKVTAERLAKARLAQNTAAESPNEATLAAAKAMDAQKAERYDAAVAYWEILAKQYQGSTYYAASLAQLSYCHGKLGDREKEIGYIQEYLKVETVQIRKLQAQFQLAQMYHKDGLASQSSAETERDAAKREELEKHGTAQIIRAEKELSHFTEAVEAAMKDPKVLTADLAKYAELKEAAMFMTGVCWARMNRPEKYLKIYRERAAKSYEDYVAVYPEGKYAKSCYVQLGTIYTALGDMAKAKDALDRLSRKYPDSDEAKNAKPRLAKNLIAMGLKKEGVEIYSEMLQAGGAYSADQFVDMGEALVEAKNWELANKAFEKAIRLAGNNSVTTVAKARLGQAKSLWRQGSLAEARKALDLFFSDPKMSRMAIASDACFMLVEVASAQGRTEKDATMRGKCFGAALGALKKARQYWANKPQWEQDQIDLLSGDVLIDRMKAEDAMGLVEDAKDTCGKAAAVFQVFIQAHGVTGERSIDKMKAGEAANLERAYATMIPLLTRLGSEQDGRVMKFGQEYLNLFPNGRARQGVVNCMNCVKDASSVGNRK